MTMHLFFDTLSEEKKNTMENNDKIFIDGDFNDSYEARIQRSKGKKKNKSEPPPTTASGSVAAPKEEKSEDFGKLKWKVGQILAEQFLKYNDGKFTAAIELNPATHALTEFIESENTALREALKELLEGLENLNSYAPDFPEYPNSLSQFDLGLSKASKDAKAIIERVRNLLSK